MNRAIADFLKLKQEQIKTDMADYGYSVQMFCRLGGDFDYAEWEIIEHLQDRDIWNGFENYDSVVNHKLFLKTVRWQAALNTVV